MSSSTGVRHASNFNGVPSEYNQHYQQQLADGQAYEHLVADLLKTKCGLSVSVYLERTDNIAHGDTDVGLEVKFDRRSADTGNLYFEVAEKSHPSRPNYVKAGIYRDDDSKSYAIGNADELFIFLKDALRQFYEEEVQSTPEDFTSQGNFAKFISSRSGQWQVRRAEISTSRGFLLRIEDLVGKRIDVGPFLHISMAGPYPSAEQLAPFCHALPGTGGAAK